MCSEDVYLNSCSEFLSDTAVQCMILSAHLLLTSFPERTHLHVQDIGLSFVVRKLYQDALRLTFK